MTDPRPGPLVGLIDACLRRRPVVLAAALLLALVGASALERLPLDAFPDTTPVQVTVNTVAPTLSPLEVERQVTTPVERVLAGLPKLREARSVSRFGFSQVTLVFEDGLDIYRARQVVAERLATVDLPAGPLGSAFTPTLGPISTGLGEVFHYLVRGQGKSLAELRTVNDYLIRAPLAGVPGVAEVNAWGGEVRQLQVVIDPARLLAHDLTVDDAVAALRQNNLSVGGGVVSRGGEATLVQGLALASSAAEIASIVVATRDGVPVLVRDVASVEDGHEVRRGAVTADGEGEAVLGLGFLLMGENSRVVTVRLAEALEALRPTLPDGVTVETVYTRTALVERVLDTVRRNLLEGALLVIAVLFAFLGDLRAGLIVALAIPLSMLFAFDLMLRFGVAGSLMSLGAIDFGLVVDSSVIMIENAERRLAEDTTGRSVREVVRDAAVEVRRPTLFGELIIMVVYLPILTLEGVEGKLFRPMALTVIFALLGSMVLSLTLMPVLASLALRRRAGAARAPGLLVRLYRPALRGALAWPAVVLGGALLVVVGGGVVASGLGAEFVPRLREGALVINTVRLASVSLEESVRYGTRVERIIQEAFPDEVERVWTRTGTADVATDPMGLELSDVFITLTPREAWTRASTQDELVKAMNVVVGQLPGMKAIFTQPIEMRVNEMVAGVRADLGIKLFGDDLEVLKAKGLELQRAVEAVPGATDVSAEQVTGLPVLQVVVDRAALARHGFTAAAVLEAVELVGGRRVGEVIDGARRFDLAVRLDDRYRADPGALGRLLLTGPDGQRVPLGTLARLELIEGPSTIQHERGRRRLVVQANAGDRDLEGFVARVRQAIATKVTLPPGYRVELGGQFEHLVQARRRLLVVVPMALTLVLALLYLTYGRVLDALRVFTGVPFAVVGGVAALWARGLPFSISAAVGFIALSGVAVLGDMVLVSTIRQLQDAGAPLQDAVRRAAETRLRPVLMTSLVAAFGFVPMALNTGVGAEVQRPLATVVIGGVISSTLLTLVVLPVLYTVLRPRGAEVAPAAAPR